MQNIKNIIVGTLVCVGTFVAAYLLLAPGNLKDLPKQLTNSVNQRDIVVKGLYVGMPIEEASTAVKQLLKNTKRYSDVNEVALDVKTTEEGKKVVALISNFGLPLIAVQAGSSNMTETIFLGKFVVEEAFGATDMTAKEFARAMVDSYSIPSLEPIDNETWAHTYESGVRIRVDTNKNIVIDQAVAQSSFK